MRINLDNLTMTPEERDAAALDRELKTIQQRENAPIRAPKVKEERSEISDERREAHNHNRSLPASQVLVLLKTELHACWTIAEVVGKWVWITLPDKPALEVRQKLYDLGFSWNFKRKCWQNPCGAFINHSKGDPREKYVSAKATDIEEAATISQTTAAEPKRASKKAMVPA